MNSNSENPIAGKTVVHAANSNPEETLRLIANLPAPDGLEDRIHAVLRTAPRRGRILAWPALRTAGGGWMRTAAAAALAFVIAGGGWGIYSRVQPGQPATVVTLPRHVAPPGGFSGASAMRMPQTLNGPVLMHPAKAPSAPGKTAKKAAMRTAAGAGQGSKSVRQPALQSARPPSQ